ncbi:MAG: hypothetical protein QOG10_7146, partial [Kribbellaceae bacterium]|nr:hypothetical protein [Kribbellaceae bacterium]
MSTASVTMTSRSSWSSPVLALADHGRPATLITVYRLTT